VLPATNITLGTWYIANLLKKFDGNIVCAVAGYNAGPGNVDKWVRANGPADADTDVFIEKIPFEETRGYVKRVLRSYGAYKMLHR
jgi:soluble lytic murein transglycosylase